MTKLRAQGQEPFMPAADYGRSLRGLGINLLVRDVARTVAFANEVLGAMVVYSDPDFAVLRHGSGENGAEWMLHADHTYASHPLLALTGDGAIRGAGVELRLHGCDPDVAAGRARAAGYHLLAEPADKPHGLREAYIADPDGYIWVPDRALR